MKTTTTLEYLAAIESQGGQATRHAIATRVAVTSAAVASALGELLRDGLIRRQDSPGNQPALWWLSTTGVGVLHAALLDDPTARQVTRDLLDVLAARGLAADAASLGHVVALIAPPDREVPQLRAGRGRR